MRLPDFALNNHQFTIIFYLLLVLLGIISFISMPRSEDPQISPPGSSIIVIYPGATPDDLEELIVDPIEEELNELDDIKEIISSMGDGLAIITIEFLIGSDPDEKYSNVIQKVNAVRNKLPAQILNLDFVKWESTGVKILQLALISELAPYSKLQYEGERLKKMFESVNGVKESEVVAYPDQEVRISVDLEKIANLNIPLSRIIQSVQSENQNIPGGNIDIGSARFNLKTSGSFNNLDELKNTVITAYHNKIVYLKDIAKVEFDYKENKYFARYKQERCVFVTATQKEGTNIYSVMDGLKSRMLEFEQTLPENMKLETVLDQTLNVTHRLTGFFINLLQGLALVGLIVFLVIGFRPSMIIMLAIPLSILMGIFLLDLSGYGIQQLSIAGLVIALGLLVDNAIVVTENITRFKQEGYKSFEAASKATSQIGWAIISSTVTTVLAFVPLLLISDVTGDFIRSMPIIVIFTLTSSLLVSLTITPYLSAQFLKLSRPGKFRRWIDRFIKKVYNKQLESALKKPKTVIIVILIIFIASLGLFPFVGVSFFPKSDRPQFIIDIELPSGSSLEKTDEVTKYVESRISQIEDISRYAANIGRGNPRVYYNIIERNKTAHYAQIFVELFEFDEDRILDIVSNLRTEFNNYPGAEIIIKTFEQGPPVEAPVAIRLLGENLEILRNISLDVEAIYRGTEGVININNPLRTKKTDLRVKINKEKAALLGIPVFEIDRTIRMAIAGFSISEFRDETGKGYDIVLKIPFEGKVSIDDLQKVYVSSVNGKQIPLSQIASIEFEGSPLRINHYNMVRNVIITADVFEGVSVDKVTKQIIDRLDSYNWPKGYNYYVAGELESRQESFGDMSKAVLIAILGILGVLVLQFKSYSQPLIVFSAIPLALIGSIIALLITGYTFSFLAFVGLTSLVGIVVNNSIILVDYTNQLRTDGMDITNALMKAGETRFLPIFVTTATTIGGLLPLTLSGGSLWAPMGWTIIGGLTISAFLTLLVVPVLYKLFTKE